MTGNTQTSALGTDAIGENKQHPLLLVAEGLHVLNQQVRAAMTGRNEQVLVEIARLHLAHGARALAVNLGPGRAMAELTPWVMETLSRELSVPLFVSAGVLAHPELLRRHGANLTINAVTADPDTLPRALALAKECGNNLVVLLVRPGLTPAGSSDRLALAAAVIDQALRADFPLPRLYLDPVLTLRPDPHALRISRGVPDLAPVAETICQLRQLDGVRTIAALGNCGRETGLQARALAVLAEAGLEAVIVNGQDPGLLRTRQDLAGGRQPTATIFRAA